MSTEQRTADLEVCAWQRNEDGYDDTSCNGSWVLEDGTPPEHGMKFCPFCGKPLVWHDYEEPEFCEHDEIKEECQGVQPMSVDRTAEPNCAEGKSDVTAR